jgi:hypothetical protein
MPCGLPRWILLASLALTGCASAHPSFERRFAEGVRSSHDLWMRLLESRYACDSGLVMDAMHTRAARVGMGPCDLATVVSPEVVQTWRTADGLREEWKFRAYRGQPPVSVYLEGSSPRALHVVPPLPRMH